MAKTAEQYKEMSRNEFKKAAEKSAKYRVCRRRL